MTTTLITGATRGLGREAARQLVAAGHDVYVGARDAARGERVAAELGARALPLDVTDEASVAAAVERVRAAGGLDVLVVNAGIGGEQLPPDRATTADLREVLETNVVGATVVLAAFAPLLDAGPAPVVVTVSSGVGSLARTAAPDVPWPPMVAYPMSKAALNMLTLQYARAYPRWRVNAVNPGLTATDFTPATAAGGHPVEQGAEILVRMALVGPDGPTATFVEAAGPIPW
jgi:NAD(P)-dependent dehydrogenase (short-subunit alcohol dehydrogenase family)